MKFHMIRSLIKGLYKVLPSLYTERLVPSLAPRVLHAEKRPLFEGIIQSMKEIMDNKCCASVLDPPTSVRGMKTLDKQQFVKNISIPTLKVPLTSVHIVTKSPEFRKLFLKVPGIAQIAKINSTDPDSEKFKLILLNPDTCDSVDMIDSDVKHKLESAGVELSSWDTKMIELSYANWNYFDILGAVLPVDSDGVGGFSTIGHIIHLNLRDELSDYKNVIGAVLLDKIKFARTVVNKTDMIDNTFRNFKMEVIGGEDDFITTVKEHGASFKMDFSKVYWNSRLSTEHQRLVEKFKQGDIVFDMFAGIGPFAIPAAKKKCLVYANDLNPESYKWLNENVKINKLKVQIHTYNMDGRDFAMEVIKPKLTELFMMTDSVTDKTIHIVMNLPALAIEFTDIFNGLLAEEAGLMVNSDNFPSIVVYCYCFNKKEDAEAEIKKTLTENMGVTIPSCEIRFVRNVAPNKDMFCIKFSLQKCILLKSKDEHEDSGPCLKKIKL